MLHSVLHTFESISLNEMDQLKLMDRRDTKFVFHVDLLPGILNLLKDSYKVLFVNNKCIREYRTLYYDTADLKMYHSHHNGKLNRFKVRHRNYVDSGTGFLEVKFKNNKGRTLKYRIKQNHILPTWPEDAKTFLKSKVPFQPESLFPGLWVNYQRITLANKVRNERVTIDIELEFKDDQSVKNLPSLAIAEIKQEKNQGSVFMDIVRKFKIREGSMSKYCMAVALTNKKVKTNSFKEKLIHIQKIINHDNHANSRGRNNEP